MQTKDVIATFEVEKRFKEQEEVERKGVSGKEKVYNRKSSTLSHSLENFR